MILGKAKALLYIGALTAALVGGWKLHGWYADSKALEHYNEALAETERLYKQVLTEQRTLYETEVQKSLTLEQQNALLRETVGSLREEIDHADLTPEIVDGCAVHPVSSPDFRMFYDKAARGGKAAGGESDSGGMSPRDD